MEFVLQLILIRYISIALDTYTKSIDDFWGMSNEHMIELFFFIDLFVGIELLTRNRTNHSAFVKC